MATVISVGVLPNPVGVLPNQFYPSPTRRPVRRTFLTVYRHPLGGGVDSGPSGHLARELATQFRPGTGQLDRPVTHLWVIADHVTQVDMTSQDTERLRRVAGDPLVDGCRAPVVVPLDYQAGGCVVRGVQLVEAVEYDAFHRAVQNCRWYRELGDPHRLCH